MPLDADALRRALREDHVRLRGLLRVLDEGAVSVIRTESPRQVNLLAALQDTVQALTEHMEREEPALAALLPPTEASVHALGTLHQEHARQREEMSTMRRGATTSDDAISLALAVRAFVADVLLDMDFEDRRYLMPGAT